VKTSVSTPGRRAGALGALLLVAAYGFVLAAFGPDRVVSFDPLGLVAFAAPAVLVGGVAAAFARWYVPAARLTREGNRRVVTVVVIGLTVLVGVGVALLAVALGAASSALEEFGAVGGSGASGVITAFTAFGFVVMLVIAIAVVVLIVLLVVFGAVLNLGAILGYAVTTLALDRYDEQAPPGPTGDPPD